MSSVRDTPASVDPASLQFVRMRAEDLPEVLLIEYDVYPHPWTRGNFLDSISSGYETWVLRNDARAVVGYFLLMPAIDEAHLLNITVHPEMQGRRIGRILLDKVISLAKEKGMHSILLEVRPSNRRALAIYKHCGFAEIGLRRNYYPAFNGREDAIVMRKPI
jgi:ribosomal-protein-alanine N-acetyltransferase